MAFSRIQNKTLIGPHPGSPYTITLDSSTTNGNALIVMMNIGTSNPTVSMTDNKGNTFAKVASYSGTVLLECWAATGITGGAGHVITITPTSDNSVEINVEEWSGLAAIGAFDRSHSASGTNQTTVDSGSTSTTRVANELLVGMAWINAFDSNFDNAIVAAGSGYSNLVSPAGKLYTESKTVSATGAYNATYGLTYNASPLSAAWDALVVTFAETNATTTTSTSSSTSLSTSSTSTSSTSTSLSTSSTSTSHSTSTSVSTSSTSTSQSTSTSISTSSTSTSLSTSSTSTSHSTSSTSTSQSTSSTLTTTSTSSTSTSLSTSSTSTSQSTSTSISTSSTSTSYSTSTSISTSSSTSLSTSSTSTSLSTSSSTSTTSQSTSSSTSLSTSSTSTSTSITTSTSTSSTSTSSTSTSQSTSTTLPLDPTRTPRVFVRYDEIVIR